MTDLSAVVAALPDKTLIVLDDDAPLRTRLGRALEARGFEVRLTGTVAEAIEQVRASAPAFAVLDLRLDDGSGLSVVETIKAQRPDARVVMLTGYGNIATAVAAVEPSETASETASVTAPEASASSCMKFSVI